MVDFDDLAATWDDDPRRTQRSKKFATLLADAVPLRTDMRALEYGAGTGQMALSLLPHVGTIVLADASAGMVEVATARIAQLDEPRLTATQLDLTTQSPEPQAFDLVYSSLVLHHVDPLPTALSAMFATLKPGGWLAAIDLEQDGGAYHAQHADFHGHDGFVHHQLQVLIEGAGFTEVTFRAAGHTTRTAHGDHEEDREFALFLVTARRPA